MLIKDEKNQNVDGQAVVARDKPESGSELLGSQHKKRDHSVLTAREEKRNHFLKESKALPSTWPSLGGSLRAH